MPGGGQAAQTIAQHAVDDEGAGAVRVRWVSDEFWPTIREAARDGRVPPLVCYTRDGLTVDVLARIARHAAKLWRA